MNANVLLPEDAHDADAPSRATPSPGSSVPPASVAQIAASPFPLCAASPAHTQNIKFDQDYIGSTSAAFHKTMYTVQIQFPGCCRNTLSL